MTTCKVSDVIAPHFQLVHRAIRGHDYTHYWLDGGRGSTKSSFASLEIPFLLIKNPTCHAVVMRKVGNTLRNSVYAQIMWAITTWGISSEYKMTVSPMEITYKRTGQKILFFGLDEKEKIKSIKLPFGYIGVAWYEELDQFAGMEEIRNVNQSLMRGGDKFWFFYSFNPPKSRDNWVNIEKMESRPDRLNHHSTYLNVPREWLGEQFIYEAELLKESKPQAYEHEYMGVATGTGGAVFDNIQSRKITDAEIQRFERFRFGLDFGFAVDPLAWVKMHYDRKHRTLYILDELYETKLKNKTAAEKIKKKQTGTMRITADSAEPKSIAEMQDYGLMVDACKKGPDSVDHGMKWLQDLEAIVIDKDRTPNAYREFTLYEYETNKNGEYISAYPDKNNHTIDAVRYGMEPEMIDSKWGIGQATIKVR